MIAKYAVAAKQGQMSRNFGLAQSEQIRKFTDAEFLMMFNQ
ncbi:glyceraldehyde-3-phosphate dehydrogenase [Oceanospirillum sp. MED92]|uniref:Glyceraldehyde-3-phosphate dehydrogenase n=1 Tax=Neptuniibacter caesariensis TaxID=207954 RepID=A0A7U8C1U9_NEPCE|nr:glyceraldehyde-3-phosphate dehydrogenase [Oceanospirillum sp. MED92] [Neptuniibacter caesariensis]